MNPKRFLPILIVSSFLVSCFPSDKPKSSAQVNVQKNGILIDATYDSRLDNLIPGYKIVTVALTNQSYDILKLNPLKDRWEVIDSAGKPRKAINSVRVHDPQTFSQLPDRVQMLIDYPVGVNIGYSETIDLFFPTHVDLRNFRTVSFYSSERDEKFDAMASIDSPNAVPLPPPETEDPKKAATKANPR